MCILKVHYFNIFFTSFHNFLTIWLFLKFNHYSETVGVEFGRTSYLIRVEVRTHGVEHVKFQKMGQAIVKLKFYRKHG